MLKVLKSGFYTSIQDAGRFGYSACGVPISGVMDSYSSQFANTLLGNTNDAAVLEMTMTGPKLQFLKPTLIAISGADMSPTLNDKVVKMNSILNIQKDDILSFGRLKSGFRAYMAIKNGFLSGAILGSQSMYGSITPKSTINADDTIDYKCYDAILGQSNALVKYDNSILTKTILDVYKGPEFNELSEKQQNNLLNNDFKVSKLNNRMAYQLEPLLENNLEQILTVPVLPGTIQLTPSGQLIVLMRDCQTTGGYPRILQLAERSISVLSQKITGNSLIFRLKD